MSQKNDKQPQYLGLEKVSMDSAFRGKLASALAGTRMYGAFSDHDLTRLFDYLEAFRAEKGSAIFVEDEKAGYMCLVVEGLLHIIKESPSGKSKKLTEVGQGQSIGEMSIIDGMPHSATAIAAQATTVAVLTKENLLKLLQDYPQIAGKIFCNIAEYLSRRLRETSGELIAYKD